MRAGRRGRGTGRRLVEALLRLALGMGKHVPIGGTDARNWASLRFHECLGFVPVAHFREIGREFRHRLDLVLVQRSLDAPGAPRT